MWISDRRVEDLNAIDVDRVLADVLANDPDAREAPTVCPECLGDLLRTTLPQSDLFVSACPNQHGIWLSRAEGDRLRALVSEQHEAALARKHDRLRVVRRTLVAALAAARGAVVAGAVVAGGDGLRPNPTSPAENPDSRRITPANWPQRDWSAWYPLPGTSPTVDHDELQYIQEMLLVLQKGADNRLNIHEVLRTTRTADEYGSLLDVYQRRQAAVLAKLNVLAVPVRLRSIHRHLVVATDRQIVLFGVFVAEKIKDSTVDLCRMVRHPALTSSSRALHAAWDKIRALYPKLDQATSDAIESRLCRFDVI